MASLPISRFDVLSVYILNRSNLPNPAPTKIAMETLGEGSFLRRFGYHKNWQKQYRLNEVLTRSAISPSLGKGFKKRTQG